MVKLLRVEGKLSTGELKGRYLRCDNHREKIRWHAMWLIKGGRRVSEVAEVVGRSQKQVCKWVRVYNKEGEEGMRDKPIPGRPPFLKEGQFEQLDLLLSSPPKQKSRWTGKAIREQILKSFKVEYSLDGIYYILHKKLYKLKSPRPYHYKQDKALQDVFKKTLNQR